MLTNHNNAHGNCQTELYASRKRLEQSETEIRQFQARIDFFSAPTWHLTLGMTRSEIPELSLEISGQCLKELSTRRAFVFGSHADIRSVTQERIHLMREISEMRLVRQNGAD
jgi:hypothetical protein